MASRETTKELTIDGKLYQLNKMDARTATWVFSFLGAKIEKEGGSILTGLGKCSRADFNEIQNMALKQIFFLDQKDGNTFPTPIIAPNGSFVDKELGSDADTVMQLTSQSLAFTLEPFFIVSGSNSQTA